MREKRVNVVVVDDLDITQEQFDQPIFWVLAVLLAYMPVASGSWDPWHETVALGGEGAIAVMLGIKLVRRLDVRFVWSWTYLPIALFFLLALFQMVPLPSGVVAAISPKTVTTNDSLLGDLPGAAQRLAHLRLSFYPEGGRHNLRNLVAVTCVFVVAINVFRRPEQMIRLLWVIAFVGCAEAVLAISPTISDPQSIYHYIPIWGNARGDSGSFPNHNCFSQFINLSTGAMIGLLLLKIDQTFHRHDYSAVELMEKLGSASFRAAWFLSAMIAISVASVFLSLSRGGMLSIVVSGLVVGVLIALRAGSRGMGIGGWLAGVILVATFAMVVASGANLVESRIARIGNPDDRYDRLQLTKDTLRAWKDYPAVGTGLGAFRNTFPAYDRSNVAAIASHAENEYAQLLEETGVAGAAIVGSFLLMMVANFMWARARSKRRRDKNDNDEGSPPKMQITRSELAQEFEEASETAAGARADVAQSPRRRSGSQGSVGSHRHRGKNAASPASSLSLGLCYGLVAILLQSATDFGQHCISIATITSIFFAFLVNLARYRRQERGLRAADAAAHASRVLRGIGLAVVVLILAFFLWQANEVSNATDAFENFGAIAEKLSLDGWKGEAGEFTDMIRAGDASVRIRPDEIRFRYWRAVYKIDAVSAGTPIDPISENPKFDDKQLAVVRGIVDDLLDACWSCPTFGPLYAQAGQWERNFLGELKEGARHIRLAYELAPGDATTCFVFAELDCDEGKWSDSVKHFQRAAILAPAMFRDALDLYLRYYHRPQSAVDLAGDDVRSLRLVSAQIRAIGKDDTAGPTTGPATKPADEAAAMDADARAEKLIQAMADSPKASSMILGERGLLCFRAHDYRLGVKYLDRALTIEYGRQDWRLVKVQCLKQLGRKDEAIQEANIILRFQPGNVEARKLLDELDGATIPSSDSPF